MEVADLYVTLRGVAGEFTKSMDEAAVASERTDGKLASVVASSKLVSKGLILGALAVGTASVVMASKFNAVMEKVHTQAGATQAEVESMKSKVLSLAGQTAQAPNDLAEALYHVESVGYRGATAMDVLSQAAKLATISGANLDDVTYGLTSVMQTYGAKVGEAANYAAMFNATVGAGDMQMQDFSKAVGTGFYSTAQSFGVSMQSASAALAFMTDRGQGAQQAATHLRMTMSLLAAPTQKAAELLGDLGMSGPAVKASTDLMTKALQKAGLSTVTMSEDLKKPDGLFVALSDLKSHLTSSGLSASAASALIAGAFGGGKTDATILSMLNNLDTLHSKFVAVGKGVSNYGEAWAATQKQFSTKVQQLKDQGEAWAIQLGEKLIPVLDNVITAVQNVIKWFEVHKQVTHDLAIAIGVVLVGALTVGIVEMAAFAAETLIAAAPFLAVSAAVGALVIGLVKLYQNNAGFRAFVDGLRDALGKLVTGGFDLIRAAVGDVVRGFDKVRDSITETGGKLHWISGVASMVWDFIVKAWDAAGRAISAVWHDVVEPVWTAFGVAATWLYANVLQPAFNWINARWAKLASAFMVLYQTRIAPALHSMGQRVSELWHNYLEKFGAWWDVHWPSIAAVLKQAWEGQIKPALTAFGNVVKWLWDNVLVGIVNWVGAHWPQISAIIKTSASEVGTAFSDLGKLISDVWSIVSAIWKAMQTTWNTVKDAISAGIAIVVGAFNSVSTTVAAVWVAVQTAWNNVVAFVVGIPAAITGALGNVGNILFGAGASIIQGFLNGLESAWKAVTGFVSGIAGWIASHKGPLSYDATLLTPHGKAIMHGLYDGLSSEWGMTQQFIAGIAETVSSMFDASGNVALGVSGGGSVGGGGRLPSGRHGGQHAGGGGLTVIVRVDKMLGGDAKKVAEELTPLIEQAMQRRGRRRGPGKTWEEPKR